MDLINEILKLKQEKNAIILAHYYQRPEIQDIADAVGDSYNLSRVAQECKEKVVVFCGVKFMAESAKILSPEKIVLLPVMDAGCPMAEMAEAQEVLKMKQEHPNALVVTYINSTTEVKALTDVCVTSSSAMKIISNIPNDEIIFLPDKNLGEYIAEQFPNKKFYLWDGFCITHRKVKKENILYIKDIKRDVKVLVHPECEAEIRAMADFIGSTGDIIKYADECIKTEYIVVTEQGVIHQMKKRNPHKNFYVPGTSMTCFNMKKTTLQDVYECLVDMKNEIIIDEDIRIKAYTALMNMHKLAR
ncbi:quinolinate synthase NadA [Clostridium sp. SYSU_GA19001]|uniref:quinolinate synthase NadA n=1 Tax=Clostridium caldaquaticum TaxID=2940653 RepID=UPI002077610D|nr:quinolinate synthase NadA [Clostridium caldaquaticum]MCM8709862.1 quinolinate synthase NadA [Clostridium caldaquaticum]